MYFIFSGVPIKCSVGDQSGNLEGHGSGVPLFSSKNSILRLVVDCAASCINFGKGTVMST